MKDPAGVHQPAPSPSPPQGVVVDVDGASSGNPGKAAAAWVIREAPSREEAMGVFLGNGLTNNEAEYWAVIYALVEALHRGYRPVEIRSDSRLVVQQLLGAWKVKEDRLKPLHRLARLLMERTRARIRWIPREENLANHLAQRLARRGEPSHG